MSTIVTSYPVFEKNQVLTDTQLNQLVKYLDQQNRLTRVSLIGLGIVCGLDTLCESANTLTITKGVGVTSEGFLIQIGDCVTTRYRNYVKPNSVSYPPFEDPETHLQDITLSELLTGDDVVDPEETVINLTDEFIQGKIVLLYLECLDKDLKSCLGKSCDEMGIDRIFTLRKLLINEEDLLTVLERTNGGKPDALYPDKFKLPPLVIPRPIFKFNSAVLESYYGMGTKYLFAVKDFLGELVGLLDQTYTTYQPVLEDVYGGNPFSSAALQSQVDQLKKYFEEFIIFERPIYGVQYIYDFLKDLTLAYNEYRETAFDLAAVCCPDLSRFPKHLMLGVACTSSDECESSPYRHHFVASPVLNQQQEKLDRVIHLHKRLALMLESFSFDRVYDSVEFPFKITPSVEKIGPLSQRTIPYYYDSKLQSSFANLSTLEDTWNYDIYRKCYPSEFPKQLSYDNHHYNELDEHPITTPLGFDIDQFNFFRVEGTFGKSVKEVFGRLTKDRHVKNIPFDIKAVYFGDLVSKKIGPKCAYAELQPHYSIWRNKGLLFFNNLVKANKNVEKVVINRKTIYESTINDFSFETFKTKGSDTYEKKTSAKAGEPVGMDSFDFSKLSKMMSAETLDFNTAAGDISNINKTLGSIMSNADLSRSASFESSRDTSIRGLFSDLNTCLQNLIQAMPLDFRKFSMEEWLQHYKCTLRMYITVMKFLASETKTPLMMLIMYILLIIMCTLYRIMRFIAIYPYITIRTLFDTAKERADRLEASFKFAQFLRDHPGMEHKAGVAPGHTFVMVYQEPQELEREKDIEEGNEKGNDNSFREKLEELLKEKGFGGDGRNASVSDDQIEEVLNKMVDTVVADFSIPYVCCDDCGDTPHTPLPLDPLATPICGIVQFVNNEKGKDDTLPWDYKPVNIRILNDLYDPSVYKIKLADDSEPNFGSYAFVDGIYDPDNSKKAQIFKYEVDEAALSQEMQVNDDLFIIDEFNYEIVDITKNEVVDKDKISIFIPIAQAAVVETGTITGSVTTVRDGQAFPIFGAVVKVADTDLFTTTTRNGTYSLENIPVGTQVLIASHQEFQSDEATLEVTTGENIHHFVLEGVEKININYERIFNAMQIDATSEEALKIQGYYSTQMSGYQKTANELKEKEGSKEETAISRAKSSIEIYANSKDISVVKLNNDYNKRRNELVEEFDNASRKDKKLYADTLEVLTLTYFNRLAVSQPEQLSDTTKVTLQETASIINSRKGIDMKSSVEIWNKNAEGYMTNEFREGVNKQFILK